jgi:hypothetical protein
MTWLFIRSPMELVAAVGAEQARALVHVVRADHGAGKFLEQVAVFVGAAGGVQESKGVGPMLVADFPQAAGDVIEGLVPSGRLELAVPLDHGLVKAVGRTGHLVHVPAADADAPVVGGMRHARIGPDDLVSRRLEIDSAAYAAECACCQSVTHF